VSNVSENLIDLKVPDYPMLTSGSITSMRKLFESPSSLITQALTLAKNNNYIGFHIDFEPESGVETSDAKLYADFLDTFAQVLHQANKILSVDIATWSPLWDFSLLAKTHVDKFYNMETYTKNITFFEEQVAKTVHTLGVGQTAIGLDSDISPINLLPEMLTILTKYEVNAIGLWRDNQPVPVEWFDFMHQFLM